MPDPDSAATSPTEREPDHVAPSRRVRTPVLIVASLTAAVCAVFGISAVASIALEREDVSQSTLDSDVERLVVRGDASDVVVVPSSDQRIHVRAEARYVTDRPSPNPQVVDGVLRLDGDCGDWWLLGGCSIDYRIAVPAGTSVDVATAAGDVSVRGLDARDVRIASDAGDVHVKLYGVPDSVDVTSDAGDVHVEVPRAPYAVQTSTDAGDVDVDGIAQDAGASSTIRASTDAGDIHIEPVRS